MKQNPCIFLDVDHTLVDTYKAVMENKRRFKSKIISNPEKEIYRVFVNDSLKEIYQDVEKLDQISLSTKYIKQNVYNFVSELVSRNKYFIYVVTVRKTLTPVHFVTFFPKLLPYTKGIISVPDIDHKKALVKILKPIIIFDDRQYLEIEEIKNMKIIFYLVNPLEDDFKKIIC